VFLVYECPHERVCAVAERINAKSCHKYLSDKVTACLSFSYCKIAKKDYLIYVFFFSTSKKTVLNRF